MFKRLICMLLLLLATAVSWVDKQAEEYHIDLTELSLEELMNIEVTSVAKKPQKLSDAAAAIFVITGEDIRRSGVTSIADALRMVPGLEVAHIDASKWAITSRGFNGRFANKLLVLIDGHSVYTPLFAGVYWEIQDVLLEDVARIEVIRGPGATLWGANAVNGVINILTKNTKHTEGGLLTVGAGSVEQGFGSFRYGGKLSDEATYRIYSRYFKRDSFTDPSGNGIVDAWEILRGGFRLDWNISASDFLNLQGDVYDGLIRETVVIPSLLEPFSQMLNEITDVIGANILARWKHSFSESSNTSLQLYYDQSESSDNVFVGKQKIFDVDLQHSFTLGQKQGIVWGFRYRLSQDDIDSTSTVWFEPDSRDQHLFSTFVQDDMAIIRDRLRLTLGSKFEHNNYTGMEIQPNIRLLWTPHDQYTVWTAISRAVKTPARTDRDVRINVDTISPRTPANQTFLPALVVLCGNQNFESEELLSHEIGCRARPIDQLSLDMATFYNVYDNLRAPELGELSFKTSSTPRYIIVPINGVNKAKAESYGGELVVNWQALEWWRMQTAYTYLRMQLHNEEIKIGGEDGYLISEKLAGVSPRHQVYIRSSMDLRRDLEFDLGVRYVDDLPSKSVESYLTLDARLGWKPKRHVELSIVGQNLLDEHHLEFGMPNFILTVPTEVRRGVYGKIEYRF